jgi:hypothetical protein
MEKRMILKLPFKMEYIEYKGEGIQIEELELLGWRFDVEGNSTFYVIEKEGFKTKIYSKGNKEYELVCEKDNIKSRFGFNMFMVEKYAYDVEEFLKNLENMLIAQINDYGNPKSMEHYLKMINITPPQ